MRIRNRYLVHWAAKLFAWGCRLIFLTVRVQRRHLGDGPLPEHVRDERFILALWHEWAVLPLFGVSTDKLAVLTSWHTDGDFVSTILKTVGIGTIRGSTSRGGVVAVREMMRRVENSHLAMTPDGPRGPRREMSRGIVYLGARSGRRVLASGFACDRCWRINGGWTDLVIPKPFSKIVMVTSQPRSLPAKASPDALEEQVQALQREMDHVDRLAANCLKPSSGSFENRHPESRSAA